MNARGGQAPALRTNRANRGNRDNPAPLLLIVEIVIILLQNPAHIFNLTKRRKNSIINNNV